MDKEGNCSRSIMREAALILSASGHCSLVVFDRLMKPLDFSMHSAPTWLLN